MWLLSTYGFPYVPSYRLPKQLAGLIYYVLYNPPNNRGISYPIVGKLDLVKFSHPDCGVVILGDFDNLNVHDLLIHHYLKQIEQAPTRGDLILDLIITNFLVIRLYLHF